MTAPFPTVHLNGTSRQMLLEGYQNAWESLQAAIEALAKVEFHPRDYYIHPEQDAFLEARKQRDQQFNDLRKIQQEIYAVIEHLTA